MMNLNTLTVPRISKVQAAKRLKISQQCLFSYLKLAMMIADFDLDYPQLNSKSLTRIGLTDYQFWVIQMLKIIVDTGVSKASMIVNDENDSYISSEIEEKLSKKSYLNQLEVA